MSCVVIYTTSLCPYCWRAKGILKNKGAKFEEIPVDNNPERRAEMITRAKGARTVPQIFINGRWIGGCDELQALDREDKLQPLLVAP